MSDLDRRHGSAAGIPEPPLRSGPGPSPAGAVGSSSSRQPTAPRRRRWLLWLAALPLGIVIAIISTRSSDTNTSAIDRLHVGDCFRAPSGDTFTASSVVVVGCDQPHTHEVYAIGTTTTAIDPAGNAETNPEIVRICRTDVAPGILAALARTPGVTPGVLATRGRAGRLVCTADTDERTGSLTGGASAS